MESHGIGTHTYGTLKRMGCQNAGVVSGKLIRMAKGDMTQLRQIDIALIEAGAHRPTSAHFIM